MEAAGLGLPGGLEIEWLGVSGYRLGYEGARSTSTPTSRGCRCSSLLLRRAALPDAGRARPLPARPGGEVAGVLVGHTHFDHAVDAPGRLEALRLPGLRLGLAAPA